MDVFECYTCSTITPTALKHEHHVKPRSTGGTDEDLVSICASCHTQIHSIAYMLLNPKRLAEAEAVLATYYKNEGTRQRIANLASIVAKEMAARADGDRVLENGMRRIAIELPEEDYYKLLVGAKDKRVSMTKFLHGIIHYYMERYL